MHSEVIAHVGGHPKASQPPLISPTLASPHSLARRPLRQFAAGNASDGRLVKKNRRSFFQSVMVRKPSSLTSASSTYSRDSSPYPPSSRSARCDADDESTTSMSADDHSPPRSLSVNIPSSSIHGPYCPRRPNLKEIMANTAESPWTLTAFMAYLSNNHCLETLEFTMDAGRYKKHYAKMMARASSDGTPQPKERDYVQTLWGQLVDAYIRPNGSREVNLPSSVRDPILHIQPGTIPPSPNTLDLAVQKIYELMEDSVLVPFLNSAYPPQPASSKASAHTFNTDYCLPSAADVYEDRSAYERRRRPARDSPPPRNKAADPQIHSHDGSALSHRQSAPPGMGSSNKSRFSTKLSQSTSSPAGTSRGITSTTVPDPAMAGVIPGASDDSGSLSTESPAGNSPGTPPSPHAHDSHASKRDSGMWKKLGRLSGMKSGSGTGGAGKGRGRGVLREEG